MGIATLPPLLLALASGAPAQVPSFPSRTDLVILAASAVDGNGRPVRDLRREEISVLEEGHPQPIVHFAHSRVLSARFLLLVDASGSMAARPRLSSAWMAAVQFLEALDPADEVSIVGFDTRYWTVVPFTRDRAQLRAGLASVTPFGATALHDALARAARDLASQGEGRRAVVLVSDGIDTASVSNPEQVIAQSKALDVPIYALSVVSPLDDPWSALFVGRQWRTSATLGHAHLSRYALLSGGAAFLVSDFGALKHAAFKIADELRHQYQLGYYPPGGPPHFRRIEVRTRRGGVVMRARRGYVPRS